MRSDPGSETRGQHRGVVRLLALAVGLVTGLGVAYLAVGRDDTRRRSAPSVGEFSFPAVAPVPASTPPPAPVLEAEPPGPQAAVELLLRAEAEGRPERAYPVLDARSRERYPTPASWDTAQVSRLAPIDFEIVATAAVTGTPDQATDVSVAATHRPSLDPFRGLVPTRSEQVWRAHLQDGRWRVEAEPVEVRLSLPSDGHAPDAVRTWLDAVATCDYERARALQAVTPLYGPADLAVAPCRRPGQWSVGQPLTLDRASDPATLLAAFGADVSTWARVVPVRGPGQPFLAAVAPLGDTWRVIAVLVDSP